MGVGLGLGLGLALGLEFVGATVDKHLLEPRGRPLLLDEDERAAAAGTERLDNELQLEPLVGRREPHALRDAAHGAAHAADGDPDVRPQEGGGEILDGAREGRGEEQRLPRLVRGRVRVGVGVSGWGWGQWLGRGEVGVGL